MAQGDLSERFDRTYIEHSPEGVPGPATFVLDTILTVTTATTAASEENNE